MLAPLENVKLKSKDPLPETRPSSPRLFRLSCLIVPCPRDGVWQPKQTSWKLEA